MKHLPIAFFAIMLLASACGNNGKEGTTVTSKENHDSSAHAHAGGAEPIAQGTAVNNDQLNAVYQHYIHLSTALTKGDVAEAKIASNAIEAGVRQMPEGSGIAASAARITTAAQLDGQRAAFSELSNQMISLLKKSGMKSGEVYVDYCPMAFNDKGAYWVSSEKEIRNPYFGDEMLTCGEVKETIK